MLEQRRRRRPRRPAVEPRGGALDADDPDELALTATDGRRHGRKALFALLAGLGEPAPPNLRELLDETLDAS